MLRKEFIKLQLTDIHPYPNNPRINDEAVAYVVESMNQTGNLDPIEVDENNVILSGHTRLLALEQLGITETECVRYTGLTEEQKRKYRLLANQTQQIALWDFEKLRDELDGLDFGEFDFGFDEEEVGGGTGNGNSKQGSLAQRYLVPPFSVIYCNKPDWLKRKRAWVNLGIHSEIGRGGATRIQLEKQP